MGTTTRLARTTAIAGICVVVFCIANVPMFAASAPPKAAPVPIISTVAGGGTPTSGNGDGGPAISASLNDVIDVGSDAAGNLYIAEGYGMRVRKVTPAGIITTVAGNGTQSYNGDGIPATNAAIDVRGLAVAGDGTLYIADGTNGRIRKVGKDGIIRTLAQVQFPADLAIGPGGVLYVVGWQQIWKVSAAGAVTAFAGDGEYGFAGDGGPATSARLATPGGLAVDASGNVLVADSNNDRIRRIGINGIITTVAGGGPFRSDPDALKAQLLHPHDVAVDSRGNLYVAERSNLVRMINPAGILRSAVGLFNDTTFGNVGGPRGFSGDGGPAATAMLDEPVGLAMDAHENLYIADSWNARVRKVTTLPTPRTPAGGNAFGTYVKHSVGSFTMQVAVGDVTGDGRVDALLTTTSWSGAYAEPANDFRLWLFVQKPDGTLAAPLKYPFFTDSQGRGGSGLAAGDLNHDGFEDVVLGTLNGIQVYLGNAAGLAPGVRYAGVTGAEPTHDIALLDVNRDGRLDVATLSAGSAAGGTSSTDRVGMIVFYGNGAGGFGSKTFTPRPSDDTWKYIRATDVDGDGLLDLTSAWTAAIAGYPSGGAEVRLHDGHSGFLATRRTRAASAEWWGSAYAFGDFNSDGRKDVVVSLAGNAPDAHYSQWLQREDGSFDESRVWSAFDSPDDLISADMNNDGKDDLLVLHGGWSSVGYQQQGAGRLEEEFKYYTVQSGNPRSPAIAVADLNGDGCRDVALADYNYGLVVLPGQNCLRRMDGSQPRVPHRSAGVLPARGQVHGAAYRSDGERGAGRDDRPGTQQAWGPSWITAAMIVVGETMGLRRMGLLVLLVAFLGGGLVWWKFWR